MSLAQKAARGAAWMMVLNWVARGVGLVGTLVLTRYLDPETIGEVQVAFVLVSTASFFSLFGLGHYIVSKPDEGREAAFHATVYSLLFGAVALGIVWALGDWLTPRFNAPAAARYLPWMVLTVALDRVAFIPTRVLVRDMRFRTSSIVRTIPELAFPPIAIGLAMAGWGGMSLIMANVVRAFLRTGATVAVVSWREWIQPCRLSWAKTKQIFGFGLPNGVATMASFAARHWDNLLIARMFGRTELGYYQYAYQLSDAPSSQVGEHIGDVLLPSFARIPPERRPSAFARALRLMAIIMFPMAIGLGAVAPTVVACFLDPDWQPVAPRLTILAALSAVYPIGYAIFSYLNAVNRPRWVMVLALFRSVSLLGTMLLLGELGGPLWACAGVGIAFASYSFLGLVVISRIDRWPTRWSLLGELVRPLLACVPLVGAVLATRAGLRAAGIESSFIYLAAEVAAGGVAFLGAALVIARDVLRELLSIVKVTLGRRRKPPEPPGVVQAVL